MEEKAQLVHWTDKKLNDWVNQQGEWEKQIMWQALTFVVTKYPEVAKALGAEITDL